MPRIRSLVRPRIHGTLTGIRAYSWKNVRIHGKTRIFMGKCAYSWKSQRILGGKPCKSAPNALLVIQQPHWLEHGQCENSPHRLGICFYEYPEGVQIVCNSILGPGYFKRQSPERYIRRSKHQPYLPKRRAFPIPE